MDRWKIADSGGIVWDLAGDASLPHEDNIEIAGRRVSAILRYEVDEHRHVKLTRDVLWPTLRLTRDDVRGYVKRSFGIDFTPTIQLDGGRPLIIGPVREIRLFEGRLTITHQPVDGLVVQRHLFPSPTLPAIIERFTVINFGSEERLLTAFLEPTEEKILGYNGTYRLITELIEGHTLRVRPNEFGNISVAFAGLKPGENLSVSARNEAIARETRWQELAAQLTLITPDPIINTTFEFAKFRAAESLFDTKMGLVHSPGGGRYYGGIWANDQAEYAGPLFGYLGDRLCHEAAMNCYRKFATETNAAFKPLPSSFEVEGDKIWRSCGDRGDAAMIASGASRYALARGEAATAEELWPLITWCLEFCARKRMATGVIASDSDELEGRFPTGEANLSTSCLAYDGFRRAADLARSLGKNTEAASYTTQADALAVAIEAHFGATVEGFDTYRYYKENTTLRAWICLPLVVGLHQRAKATVAALFSPRLWSPDGLATEAGGETFWDRSTLYALRGVFAAGETETALRYLAAYSRRRLLGDHVPYAVEAYPEGAQAHLSAESALYCRVLIEGLLGLVPTGLRAFALTPRLPDGWPGYTLSLTGFGHRLKIGIARDGDLLHTKIVNISDAGVLFDQTSINGTILKIALPE
jgi:hypothetical protein